MTNVNQSETNGITLLPCPFCGSENVELDNVHSTVAVACRDCSANGAWAIRIEDGEQRAIEAWNTRITLGSGTLTAEQVRGTVEKHWHDLPDEYDMPEATALPEYSYDWQAIADELNAALGVGECVPHGEWESISQTQEVRRVFCECGHELGMDRRDSLLFERTQLFAMPNYCQECGRKIRKAVKR